MLQQNGETAAITASFGGSGGSPAQHPHSSLAQAACTAAECRDAAVVTAPADAVSHFGEVLDEDAFLAKFSSIRLDPARFGAGFPISLAHWSHDHQKLTA